jgi:hypothetical protein
MKKTFVVGAVLVGFAAIGPAAQADAPTGGNVCADTIRTADGASNRVIVGDAVGVGNGQGVTVTRDCRPRAAAPRAAAGRPARPPAVARKPAVAKKPEVQRPVRPVLDCRRVAPERTALCLYYLRQINEAMRRAQQPTR